MVKKKIKEEESSKRDAASFRHDIMSTVKKHNKGNELGSVPRPPAKEPAQFLALRK